jgi:glycosyltransferase involved in cell wall biosynthesis
LSAARICIDGFNLSLARGSGIATYARNLGGALRAIGYETQFLYGPPRGMGDNNLLNEVALYDAAEAPRGWVGFRVARALVSPLGRTALPVRTTGEVIQGGGGSAAALVWAAKDVFHRANVAYSVEGAFTPISFAERGAARRPDAAHWTAPLPLYDPKAANLYTIHDLVPLRLPYATLDNKRRFYTLCASICREADHVVTVSETSKADIVRMFGIDEGRITNTYQAVDLPPELRNRPEAEVATEIEGVFNLEWGRYFLFYGAIEPKKNLARVIEAYLAANVEDPLVIIGGQSWLEKEQTALLYEDIVRLQHFSNDVLRRADRVRRYDYVPFPILVSLIRGAKAVLFPSLYEGFGLPVLEAMQLGAPVLSSTGGAIPEVAGDAALLVDPVDVQAIRRGIRVLDKDEGVRADLARRGPPQAAKYSSAAYQQRLAKLYGAVL